MRSLIVFAHNIRSTHNVGAILRTAEGFGVDTLICSGYTPYPIVPGDTRLPHIRDRLTATIAKTALGAERLVKCQITDDPTKLIATLKNEGYRIVALEQAPGSIELPTYQPPDKLVLLLGEEVHGIPDELLACADEVIEIPMYGRKESFNVSVAAGIALYHLRTHK